MKWCRLGSTLLFSFAAMGAWFIYGDIKASAPFFIAAILSDSDGPKAHYMEG